MAESESGCWKRMNRGMNRSFRSKGLLWTSGRVGVWLGRISPNANLLHSPTRLLTYSLTLFRSLSDVSLSCFCQGCVLQPVPNGFNHSQRISFHLFHLFCDPRLGMFEYRDQIQPHSEMGCASAHPPNEVVSFLLDGVASFTPATKVHQLLESLRCSWDGGSGCA